MAEWDVASEKPADDWSVVAETPAEGFGAKALDAAKTVGRNIREVGPSLAKGVVKGVEGIAGFPGDAAALMDPLSEWLGDQLGLKPLPKDAKAKLGATRPRTTAEIQSGVESVTGKMKKPETTAGRAAETVGEFLPSTVFGGPRGMASKLAGAAVGGLTSEAAGRLTEGSDFEGLARAGGGLLGGFAGGMAAATPRPRSSFDDTFEAFERLGLSPTAATTGVGGKTVKWLESNVLPASIGSANRMEKVVQSNTEQFVQRQQDIASRFGAAKLKVDTGEEMQQTVLRGWQGQKEEAGKIFTAIEGAFGPNDFYDPKNLVASVNKPLVAADSAAIKAVTDDPVLAPLKDALDANGGLLTFKDMKALKTTYSDMISPDLAKTPNEAQISKLVNALDKDMEKAVESLGNPDVLKDWHYAKATWNNAMTDYRTAFKKLLGTKDLPVKAERVYDIMVGQAGTKGPADIEAFEKVWRTLGPQKQGDLSATILAQMGNTDPTKFGTVDGFSFSTFLTNYKNLSPTAKDMLFKQTGTIATQQALDDLLHVADKISVWGKLASKSNSNVQGGMLTQAAAGAGTSMILASTGHWMEGLAFLALDLTGPYAASQVLTRPKAVKMMANALNKANEGAISAVRNIIALDPITVTAHSNGNQGQGGAQPPEGAQQAPDGNWYLPDPNRPGKFLKVVQ